MPSFKFVFAAAALLVAANAKTVKIMATKDNRFDPNSITAKKGDILEFHFKGPKHSVVSGDYQNPCAPLQIGTGFFSDFISGFSIGSAKSFNGLYVFPGTDISSPTGQDFPRRG